MMRNVSEDRLTRQELGWLLMQEARGTARALRNEVGLLKTGQDRLPELAPPVDSMLDALDSAIDMMSALEGPSNLPSAHNKDRRGRIDIAALIFDIAPNAKIAIEPGAGTEVFGVESELRRVLALLIEQSGSDTSASSAIEVHRDNDWVVVGVAIGPEGMPTRDLEHRWLNRMATRHGGRVELTGNVTRLCLPADTSSGQQEIQQLRKELEQAQQLGEVYARELAEAFSASAETPVAVIQGTPLITEPSLRVLVSTAASILRTLRSVTDALRQDIARIGRLLGDQHDSVVPFALRLVAYGELMSDLERIARTPLDDPQSMVDLAEMLRRVADSADARARRHGVSIALECPIDLRMSTRAPVLELLVRALLDQAVQSTPRSGSVAISATALPPGLAARESSSESCPNLVSGNPVVISIEDGGPIVPDGTSSALLTGLADPSTIGRAGALSWITAGASASTLGLRIEVGVSKTRRSEVRLTLD